MTALIQIASESYRRHDVSTDNFLCFSLFMTYDMIREVRLTVFDRT